MLTLKTVPSGKAFAAPGTSVTMPSSVLSFEVSKLRACRAVELGGVDSSADGDSGVSIIPASGLLCAAGAGAGRVAAGGGAGAVTAGGVAGVCSVVVIASLAGGTETPS